MLKDELHELHSIAKRLFCDECRVKFCHVSFDQQPVKVYIITRRVQS